jgi:hypothetical protein
VIVDAVNDPEVLSTRRMASALFSPQKNRNLPIPWERKMLPSN